MFRLACSLIPAHSLSGSSVGSVTEGEECGPPLRQAAPSDSDNESFTFDPLLLLRSFSVSQELDNFEDKLSFELDKSKLEIENPFLPLWIISDIESSEPLLSL